MNNIFDDDEKNLFKQEKLTESLFKLSILSEILDVAIELTILDSKFNVLHCHLYEQHKNQKQIKILNCAETFVYNN